MYEFFESISDNLINKEFFIMSAGVIFYFTTVYAVAKERNSISFGQWFEKNKIWILLTFMIGMMCIIWDDESILAYEAITESKIPWPISGWVYFLAAPALTSVYRTFTKKYSVNG